MVSRCVLVCLCFSFSILLGETETVSEEVLSEAAASVTEEASAEVAPLEACDVLVAELTGEISIATVGYVKAVFEQAEERGAEDVLLVIQTRSGSYSSALEVMELIAGFSGRVHAYVEKEAIGTAALVALTCDTIFSSKTALMGDVSVLDEEAEDGTTELSNYKKARARSFVPEVPFRDVFIRAVTERDFEWRIGGAPKSGVTTEDGDEAQAKSGTLIKGKGSFLLVTGREAAKQYATPNGKAPLLVEALYADVDALKSSEFVGKNVQNYEKLEVPSKEALTAEDEAGEAGTQSFESKDMGSGLSAFVVPIEGPIDTPQLYILRRALKEAITEEVEIIVIDMDTPGGRMDVMFEMMQALDKFEGITITYVNDEAISAGSFIAVATDEIYFSPKGVMGASAVVSGGGEEIPETLKQKIDSYVQAKVRALTEEHPYRADVLRAMSDESFVFKLDGHILKKEGELLTVTAQEAEKKYGYPPKPLISLGTRASVDDLLTQRFGKDAYSIKTFEVTWSEEFAKWFNTIAPLLMGVGMLLLFIEFKTPNFGILGGLGIALMLLVFASNYFAGMSGYEEILIFALGVVFIAVELFVLPGYFVFGLAGLAMIVGSLVWALADIWPTGSKGYEFDPEVFYGPALQVAIGLCITFVGMALLWRYLPETWIWKKMVLSSSLSEGGEGESVSERPAGISGLPDIGSQGTAITNMFPSGEVEIEGRRYQARAKMGSISKTSDIEVVAHGDFGLIVAEVD